VTSLNSAAAVTSERLARAASEPDQWLAPGRDPEGTYFSPLADINTGNVARLGFAWQYKLGSRRGLEATPLVIDGVMYAVGNFGRVYALDATSGRELWIYDPHIDGQWARYACCDAVNRGLVAFDGRLYVGALDGWLHAIDSQSGRLAWKVDTITERQQRRPYTLTGAPLLAGDMVVIGNAGADFAGARGYVSAYDLKTGAMRWRFYTVPRDPAEGPQEQPHLDAALKTWDRRHPWKAGIGGNVWDGMSFDPVLNLVYVGTANPGPYNSHADGRTGGDELYAASILAIHADTGTLAWYYQSVPGDRWDYDATQKFVLADIKVRGQTRQVIMQAQKNGFFYVLDRKTGELLSARNFAFVSWTKGINEHTGRPEVARSANYDQGPALLFPSEAGAHSWQPMAYDASRGIVFIPTIESGNVIVETGHRPAGLVEGQFTTPAIATEDYDPAALKDLFGTLPPLAALTPKGISNRASRGFLRAWNVAEHRVAWEVPTASHWDGGVLATAGGVVLQGDATGALVAYAADTGQHLATLQLGSSMMAAPITYRINGIQYVAIMAGYGGGDIITGAPLDPLSAAYRYGNEGRIIVLKIGGGVPPLPPLARDPAMPALPARIGDAQTIARGDILYNRYCLRCHVLGRGILPDLRRASPATHAIFRSIVLQGAYVSKGMGRFDDVLSESDVDAIHSFIVDQAWQMRNTPDAAP
jgi:quinohemoprotein ethanol dehydrogenase